MGFVNGAGYTVAAFSAKIFAALLVVQGGFKDCEQAVDRIPS
jgi:hypothetical protein